MALTCTPVIDDDCSLGGALVSNVASSLLDEWAKAAGEAAASVMKMVVAGWVYVPSGKVTDPNVDKSGAVAYLHGHTHWLLVALTVAALLFAATRMALQADGREASQLARNIGIMVLLAGAGVPAIVAMMSIGDSYSTWIIDKSADGQFGQRMALIATAGVKAFPGVHLMILIMGVIVALSGIMQLLMLVGRSAALILMAGLLPVVAAGAVTGRSGMQTRNRYLSWLLAILLYKPAAATIYAASFWAIGRGEDVMDLFIALALFVMAVFALPALMRLIAPAVAAVSSSGSSGMGMALAGGAGALATGAMQMSSGATGSGTGDGGSAGPSGAGMAAPSGPGSASGGQSAVGGTGPKPGPAGGAAAGSASAGTSAGAASASGGGAAAAGAAGGPAGAAVMAGAAVAKAAGGAAKQVSSAIADGATGEQGSR